jgi:nitroreductase
VSRDADPPREPYDPERPTPDEALEQVRAFREHMDGRRSVRDFSTRKVPRAVIEEILRVAKSAPSGANKQPWSFVAIQDEELKQRIRDETERQEREFYEEKASDEWLDDLAHLGTDWRKPHLTEAPWVIVVFAQDYESREDGSKGKHYYVNESVGIAVGFLFAAVRQAGLACLPHTPSPMDFLHEELDRPDNERAYLVVPIGYPAENCQVPAIDKQLLDDVVDWH